MPSSSYNMYRMSFFFVIISLESFIIQSQAISSQQITTTWQDDREHSTDADEGWLVTDEEGGAKDDVPTTTDPYHGPIGDIATDNNITRWLSRNFYCAGAEVDFIVSASWKSAYCQNTEPSSGSITIALDTIPVVTHLMDITGGTLSDLELEGNSFLSESVVGSNCVNGDDWNYESFTESLGNRDGFTTFEVSLRPFVSDGAYSLLFNISLQCTPSATPDPTLNPSSNPTITTPDPSHTPSITPTKAPTNNPSIAPTRNPTKAPTNSPSKNPTEYPTKAPTNNPSIPPTRDPTSDPTRDPTRDPTSDPTKDPTKNPTKSPTESPTNSPTFMPTERPTNKPTRKPTGNSRQDPTAAPLHPYPTRYPTPAPTSVPAFKLDTLLPVVIALSGAGVVLISIGICQYLLSTRGRDRDTPLLRGPDLDADGRDDENENVSGFLLIPREDPDHMLDDDDDDEEENDPELDAWLKEALENPSGAASNIDNFM